MTQLDVNRTQQTQEHQRTQDTLIAQKVNLAHRAAFRQRFPGQIEHCMRLVAERLQAVLVAKPTDLSDPNTWAASPAAIHDLCCALDRLAQLNHGYPTGAAQND